MNLLRLAIVTLPAFTLLLATACGSPQGKLPHGEPAIDGMSHQELSAPVDTTAISDLPSPAALLRLGSFEQEAGQFCFGAGFEPLLPNALASTNGPQGVFQPQWDVAAPLSGDMAYAIYRFDLSGFGGTELLTLNWEQPPATSEDVWLGLSNWQGDRWDWHNVPGNNELPLADLTAYTAVDGTLLAVLLLLGDEALSLKYLRFGADIGPFAYLVADNPSGDAPLTVTFYAIDSYDLDGEIANYTWDLDGDGEFAEEGLEYSFSNLNTATATYDTSQVVDVAVRAIDNNAGENEAHITVTVNALPEVTLSAEPNSGVAPLTVLFTTIASDADGTITDYEWDLDADEIFSEPGPEATAQGAASAQYEYTLPGSFLPQVRVTDDFGSSTIDNTLVFVAGWDIVSVDGSGDPGWWNDLELNSSGLPCIGHYNDDFGILLYSSFDGAQWSTVTVDSVGQVGSYCAMDLDSLDRPHFSYYDWNLDGDDGGNLKYAFYTGSEWDTDTLEEEGDVGRETDIAVDSQDHPHIAYMLLGTGEGNSLRYITYDGMSWNAETVSATMAWEPVAIDVTSLDLARIAYGSDGADGALMLAIDTGIFGFSNQTADAEGNTGDECHMVLNGSDFAHFSYYADYNIDELPPHQDLRYCFEDGDGYHAEGVDTEGLTGLYTSIALDSQGLPHIAYNNYARSSLDYAHYTGTEWVLVTVDDEEDPVVWIGWYTSIAIGADDLPHIAYHYIDNGEIPNPDDNVYELRYVKYVENEE